jgi:predicted amidohydrolase
MRISDRASSLWLVLFALLCLAFPAGLAALEREVVVSVYQGPCKDGDFPANLAVARQVAAEALARGSDFVALPETFLSGYDTPEHMRAGARRLDDPELKAFIAESAKHKMVILVGLARITDEGIYNTELVIQQGRLLGMYDKVMLTEGDRDELKFVPGKDVPVFEANGAKFAVIICHDTSFPHVALLARLQGAEILFTPHYNNIGAQNMDDHRIWVRNCHVGLACQLKMVVARSNVVVTGGDQPGYGDSFILSPEGEVLAGAKLFRTGLITTRITPAMFKYPYVWADLTEVPQWVRNRLAGMLEAGKNP